MKTITLTDEQFDTLFEYTKVLTIDGEFEDLFDVHTILGETKQEYERKLQIAQAKQPKAEW